METRCTCPVLYAGSEPTGARNWNDRCPEHGLGSDWWNSPAQQQVRAEKMATLRSLYDQRRAASGEPKER